MNFISRQSKAKRRTQSLSSQTPSIHLAVALSFSQRVTTNMTHCTSNWKKRIKGYSIYLSSQKSTKVSNRCCYEKRSNNSIKVLFYEVRLFSYFQKENQKKSKYPSCKGKIVVVCDKKLTQEVENATSLDKVDKYIFFISPLGENVHHSWKEK